MRCSRLASDTAWASEFFIGQFPLTINRMRSIEQRNASRKTSYARHINLLMRNKISYPTVCQERVCTKIRACSSGPSWPGPRALPPRGLCGQTIAVCSEQRPAQQNKHIVNHVTCHVIYQVTPWRPLRQYNQPCQRPFLIIFVHR